MEEGFRPAAEVPLPRWVTIALEIVEQGLHQSEPTQRLETVSATFSASAVIALHELYRC